MSKPHWEKLHEWRLSDIKSYLEDIWCFKKLLRKHPEDKTGELFRDCIKGCKKALNLEVKEYTKIYGDKPDLLMMRREAEKGE